MTFADIPIGSTIVTESFCYFKKLTEEGLCCSKTAYDMVFSRKEKDGDSVWRNNGCNLYHFSEVNQRISETNDEFVRNFSGDILSGVWKTTSLKGVEEDFLAEKIVTRTSERNIKNNFDRSYTENVYGWLPSIEDVKERWWAEYIKPYPKNGFWNYQLLFREGKGRSEIYYYNTREGEIKSGAAYVERKARPLYRIKTDTEMVKKENGNYLIIYTPSHDISIEDSKFQSFLTL